MKYIYLYLIIFLIFSYYPFKNYFEYKEYSKLMIAKREEIEYLEEENSNLNDEEVEEYIYDEIITDNEFLKKIYTCLDEVNLDLDSISNLIEKENDSNVLLVYRELKLKGNLYQFYKFLKKIYDLNIMIDNSKTVINLNSDGFKISLGYLKNKV